MPDDPKKPDNLDDDRTELNNLASSNPDKAKELERAWTERMDEFRKLASEKPPARPAKPKRSRG